MRLRQIAGPTNAIALADAKMACAVDHDEHDDLIAAFILAAGARAEQEAGFAFGAQTWEAVMQGFPAAAIDLDYGPLASVTSITYVDADGASQTMDSAAYEFEQAARLGVISALSAWPVAGTGVNSVVVRFVVGGVWPPTIQQAVRLMVAHWYRNRETASDTGLAEIPYGAAALIGLHRRMAC